MSKTRISISIFFLRIIYKLICGLVSVLKNSAKLISIKIAIGTLIISLNASLLFSQELNSKKEYTLTDPIMLDNPFHEKDEISVLCYASGPPTYQEPFFYGGTKAIKEHFDRELIYPLNAISKKIEGFVQLSYAIYFDGTVKDIKVIEGLGYGCDEEAVRILKSLPRYRKGYKDGKPEIFNKTISIEFKLPKE